MCDMRSTADFPAAAGSHRLRLLGGFEVVRGGRELGLSHQAQRLVAYLALHGRRARTDISGTLWPDASEQHAQGSLRTAVWRLDRGAGPLLDCHGQDLALAQTVTVDVHELVRCALALIRAERCESPEDWLRWIDCGDLLPGWYDDWVLFERERLRQLRLHALELAAERLLANGRPGLALAVALEAVRVEPLRESAHRQVLAIHLAEGNLGEALRQYDALCRLLRLELGVEPSAQTARMVSLRLPPDAVDLRSREQVQRPSHGDRPDAVH
jgi:DNA-binding SARP family transcriptional activator